MKGYDELHGGTGRSINFRPTRYRVANLLRDHPPNLKVNGAAYKLHDVAMNGIAFLDSPKTGFKIGDQLEIELSIGKDTQFVGVGEVAHVKQSIGRSRIGVSLPRDFIDIPGLIDHHEEIALAEALSGGADLLHEAVPPEYREVVERAVLFVQHTRDVLDRNEARLRSRGLPEQRVLELAGDAARSLQPTWTSISRAAARALAPHQHDRRTTDACHRYTRLVLTSLLMDAPGIRRAVEKPLGYPGDYETMNYIYRDELEGGSAFAKVFHKFGVDEPLAAGARTRKELIKGVMREEHLRVLASRGPEATFDVLGLGCGPAVEVEEYIREWKAWAGSVRWTLVDQEEAALSIAYAGAYRALTQTGCSGQVRCFYLSFQQMSQEPKLQSESGKQDLIYAAGFFDYLIRPIAQGLINHLVDRLAPDGVLLIGNAIGPNEHFWFAEHILDWPLIYRTQEDIEDLGRPVLDRCTMEIRKDSLGVYHVLVLRRHADL